MIPGGDSQGACYYAAPLDENGIIRGALAACLAHLASTAAAAAAAAAAGPVADAAQRGSTAISHKEGEC